MFAHPLQGILNPQSIAVVGASQNQTTMGYGFVRHLQDYGYRGKIYPVNPHHADILGMKSYTSITEIPECVDYVISCIPATEVLNLLKDCSQKGVQVVHLFTGRFSETGRREAITLEQEILRQARKLGIRLIGPNCMGLYYPREGISFSYDFPRESGTIGLASQSGGGATYFVHSASLRGIRFSKVISYGNALDFNECDFLDYFSLDPETKIILMYIEGISNGRKFFNALSHAASCKPVIIIKGGREKSGLRSAASHTAALAIPKKIWKSIIAQAGAIPAEDFDEMADLAVSLHYLPRIRGLKVGVAGIGGGPSVLAADQCEEAGLDVIPLPENIREELKRNDIPIWDWIGNPVDVSIIPGFTTSTDMIQMMARVENFDLIIAIINEYAPLAKVDMLLKMRTDVKGYIELRKENLKPLMVVVGEKGPDITNYDYWRWRMFSEARAELLAANIPVYPTIKRAATAARRLADYYQRKG